MRDQISVSFDPNLKGYIIRMPDFISLAAMEAWKEDFECELRHLPPDQKAILLVDINRHHFESIQCMKSLRDLFTTSAALQSNGVKAAFVSPAGFMEPQIKSEAEAYFESFGEAYDWLSSM